MNGWDPLLPTASHRLHPKHTRSVLTPDPCFTMLAFVSLAADGLVLSSPMTMTSAKMQPSRVHASVYMQQGEATRDPEDAAGRVDYNANDGWVREENIKEMKGKHTMSGDFEATDTPDFFDESEYSLKVHA